ncbi:MAG: RsmB/NOP family class I SAM-dependent RNA methyltransferase [Candidatus Marinimicrobia bacterium]|nr:RsmB/NOP family class I SAM-dependent RNA methyltransferase [Candidatus Neomarinimicrobiota bacterium]
MNKQPYLDYEEYVEKYRSIIDDFDLFLDYSRKPLPKIIWTNLLKTYPEFIVNLLHHAAVNFERIDWWEGAFKVASDFKPGNTIEYLSGQIHVQEEVSMLPVVAMNPQKGDTILDMCAAPGNKTAGICLKMAEEGLVVANDIKSSRVALLQNNLSRLGFINVVVTQSDGMQIRDEDIFDKILVDAPCSAEGNIRKSQWSRRNDSHSLSFQPIQIKLLNRALKLVKKGGEVIYSTCTYSPDENEVVVNAVLQENIVLQPLDFPDHFCYSKGLTSWQNTTFHESLQKCGRIWPHQNDTGGFFVAKFKKLLSF